MRLDLPFDTLINRSSGPLNVHEFEAGVFPFVVVGFPSCCSL
jgi:hypothetical protein